MQAFAKVLYAGIGTEDEVLALKQAVSVSRNNKALLTALVIYPPFPAQLQEFSPAYERALREKMDSAIEAVRNTLLVSATDVHATTTLVQSDKPSVALIRQVLADGHDLVIKKADAGSHSLGFTAPDMELLRKCPVPVWLCRPIEHHRDQIRVAVAVDPRQKGEPARTLSLRLLKLARALADSGNGELTIISCHEFEFAEFIKDTANLLAHADLGIEVDLVEDAASKDNASHRVALDELIAASAIGGKLVVQHMRGRPEHLIPQFVTDREIDILVMGTVARTGVAELLIGNTAESIVSQLSCSLVALKPDGFVTSVK